MNCMKCGRKTVEEQVFCPECLSEMERYPVKPGTAVQLPAQGKETPARKTQRKKMITAEEQLRRLKSHNRVLAGLLALALVLLMGLTSYMLWRLEQENVDILPGQNYSAEETTVPEPQ